MNAELIDVGPQAIEARQNTLPAPTSPAGMMMTAIANGLDLAQVEKMMDLQDRWERREAEKAYNVAFSAFKAEAVRIIKAKTVTDGPLKGKSYAELHNVVDAVTPALSRHGLSAAWKVTRDEKDWLEVTCTLKHTSGHSESVSMGGMPDAGGAKNALQARASSLSYLSRYTLKAICGVAEGGDDTDGNAPSGNGAMLQEWIANANAATTVEVLRETRKMAGEAFSAAQDVEGWNAFKLVASVKKDALEGAKP